MGRPKTRKVQEKMDRGPGPENLCFVRDKNLGGREGITNIDLHKKSESSGRVTSNHSAGVPGPRQRNLPKSPGRQNPKKRKEHSKKRKHRNCRKPREGGDKKGKEGG